ncbi:MAG: hypothetical protein OSW77_02820, partial [Proteobacteria bacterium]|nr:hypothetical protein [Pseudomonadota bacterium]
MPVSVISIWIDAGETSQVASAWNSRSGEPATGLCRLQEKPAVEMRAQTCSFDRREDRRRRHPFPAGPLPAQQGLDPDAAPVARIHLRLQVQLQAGVARE